MSQRPDVLFLVHRIPYPPNRGDRIRSFHILKHLARRYNVHLATLADEPVEAESLQALKALCKQVAIEQLDKGRWLRAASNRARGQSATEGLFYSRALRCTIERWAGELSFDAIVVFCSSMFQYVDIPALRGVRTVVDLVDVDSQKFFDYARAASFWKAWLYGLEGHRLRSLERTIAARADAVCLVSEAEADIYRGFCPNDKTLGIPNGVDLDYFQPQSTPPAENRCVFVGALDYPPNIDAMLWLCRDVWPRVRGKLPDATLAIVGRNPTRSIRELASVAGVDVVGSVPDVRPHMASAAVAIAPLRIARGIQNKVLEAMAMRLPVIVSPGALEGLALEPGRHVLLAENADQWVRGVVQLCSDQATAARLGRAGRQFVESEHNWSTCLEPLDGALGLDSNARPANALTASVP
jgi:sugar transferase (PEP-CTERM/EpsH1 system associated)